VAVKRKRLPVWTVRWSKTYGEWRLRGVIEYDYSPPTFIARNTTKAEMVGRMRQLADRFAPGDPGTERPVSVRIYTKTGRIQEERTYGPPGSDPRRSRG
jgi:hypothetical protein